MINAVIPIQYSNAIQTVSLVGGMSIQKQRRLLSYKPSIVVATPGRLWDLLGQEQDEYLVQFLPKIQCLVLDEADRFVATGHFKELSYILSFIYKNS